MASFILGKRDLRTRSRTTVADKKSKKGKSAAAQKLEALYKQDIENEEFDRDDEKDFLETDEATLNRKNEIDEGVGQHLVIQHLLNDVESNRYDFEGSQNLENIVTDEAMSKKEKKCCKRYDEMKKDFATMNDKVEQLGKEWKIVKRIIQRWGPQPGSSDEMDDENYDELPRFPLKKVKHVNLMYENINNPSYKKQLVSFTLFSTHGNACVEIDINHITNNHYRVIRLQNCVRLAGLPSRKMLATSLSASFHPN